MPSEGTCVRKGAGGAPHTSVVPANPGLVPYPLLSPVPPPPAREPTQDQDDGPPVVTGPSYVTVSGVAWPVLSPCT